MNKLRKVVVDTPKGKRFLTFRPIIETEEEIQSKDGTIVRACDAGGACPYGKIVCENLKDPRNPDDPEVNFMDFCANVGEYFVTEPGEEKSDVKTEDLSENYVPADGTLEENLFDIDNYYQTLIEKKRLVKISDVIDCFCPDTCPFYDKDHTQCTPTNEICTLLNLIHGRK